MATETDTVRTRFTAEQCRHAAEYLELRGRELSPRTAVEIEAHIRLCRQAAEDAAVVERLEALAGPEVLCLIDSIRAEARR